MEARNAPARAVRGPAPDPAAAPEGFVVEVASAERIHFLDWGAPASPDGSGVLLIHGLRGTAWGWAAVARRLVARRRTVAMDLRGHGLSDSPTDGYDPATLADDVLAVAEGSGLLAADGDRVVLAGHGFGAIVAAWAAVGLGGRCAGLVLVDGGLEDIRASTGMEPDEFIRGIEEPPEVLRSMAAWLADREAFDPSTWDADAERAARAAVVELPAGRVVASVRPHALEASVAAMFEYRPAVVLPAVTAPIRALLAAPDGEGRAEASLDAAERVLAEAGRPPIIATRFPTDGHDLPRYRAAEVATAILEA